MGSIDDIIGRIYETAAIPGLWADFLDDLGRSVGALGGNVIRSGPAGVDIASSPSVEDIAREFISEGWNDQNIRVQMILERTHYPGFLTDLDFYSVEDMQNIPMYRDFLIPRASAFGAGTIIQGADHDSTIITIEGFFSPEKARTSTALLNKLRPHLARAAILGSQIRNERAATLVEAFNTLGVAVALLDGNCRVLRASSHFAAAFDDILLDGVRRLQLIDPVADQRLVEGIQLLRWLNRGCSIALRDRAQFVRAVLHLIPAKRAARDMFDDVRIFAVLANPENHALPEADIIAALFDLTPAEARVARGIAASRSPAQLALENGTSIETVRSQLKRAFTKTLTSRQSERVSLLTRLG